MGNIHEIFQVKPGFCKGGAAVPVKREFYGIVEKLHKEEGEKNYFYTYLERKKINFNISNCNAPDKVFQDECLFFVIQSGGKMRMGIKDFKKHLEKFSKYLEDALFYMDDEFYGFIDEYRIKGGRLYCKRAKEEGNFMAIEDFLKEERPMNFDDIMNYLKRRANPKNREGMAKFGINTKSALGVEMPVIHKIAKEIEGDHKLALRLWDSKIHEAKILATLIDDADLIDEEQMWKWVEDFDSWDICDQCCNNLFYKTPFAWEKACQWSTYPDEFIKRAGFILMAVLAVRDKKASDRKFLKLFKYIKKGSADERNFVKKAVNRALRQIGKRNEFLNKKSLKTAREIQSQYPKKYFYNFIYEKQKQLT